MKQLLSKLTRITSSGNFIPEIDGLRFLAILWVFLYHLNIYLNEKGNYLIHQSNVFKRILENGYLGVELFFVISGFVLGLPFANYYIKQGRKINLKKYFTRRLTRLEPPYFLVMILLFIASVGMHIYTFRDLFPHLAASLFYLHNFLYPGTRPYVNGVAWSLEVEVQFYILAPFIAYIFVLRKAVRRALLVFIMLAMPVIQHWYNTETIFLYQYIQYFITGFLLADIYVNSNKKAGLKSPSGTKDYLLAIIGALMLTGILILPIERNVIYAVLFPIMILLFYAIVLFIPFWNRVFSIKWISVIGGMCYTIYLIHWPLTSMFGRFFIKYKITDTYVLNFFLQFILVGSVTLVVSSLFFYYIEKPCMVKNWHIKLYEKIVKKAG